MSISLNEHITNLRGTLCGLAATGSKGFEGLLGEILSKITGVPFRLAGSGSQFGLDGKAAYEDDAVCFEGKRYDGDIPRTEVLSKIAELSIGIGDKGDVDLWVLGATQRVRAQLADDARALGARSGIAISILDWADSGLPPLAVALAMAGSAATDFLEKHVEDKALTAAATAALKTIRESSEFTAHAERIRAELQEPAIGAGLARQANGQWLEKVFSNKREAKRFLRQPLAPGDKTGCQAAERATLVSEVTPLLAGKPDGRIGAILGDEGTGKSWLVAQSWLSLKDKPLMVVFTADDFREVPSTNDLTEKLIGKLIEQTGGQVSEAAGKRWRRKLERWRKEATPDAPRLVVTIDGLNQRPGIDWARLLEAMAAELDRIGGRLIVTARTNYYASHIKRRLVSSVVEVNVPEWTEAERDAILTARGIRVGGLRASVAQTLRNPRVLGIALELLQSAQIEELEELTVSRLLFEHMRAHERDAPAPRPVREFARQLQDHAREVLSRVTAQRQDDLKVFDGALEKVSDGRFFIPVEDDPTRYTLEDNGLTLALGFAMLDELHVARRNQRDLAEALEAIIEPVGALDRTAEAVFAALTVACLDDECPAEIGAAIVGAFAELQNPNADEFQAFASLAEKRVEPFMFAARRMCLSSARQPNFDWIEAAMHAAKRDDGGWAVMAPIIQSWLGQYTLSPEARMYSHPSHDDAEKVEKERQKVQDEIDERMGTLSTTERDFLNTLTRLDNGDLATLTRLALTLIAGKPVAPFARSLAHWAFANALNSGIGAPYDEFMHLIRLNRIDWTQSRDAILEICKTFESAGVSRTGKWALANLLRATGNPDDARRGEALVEELTADRPKFAGWRLVEKYCASDPCDPASAKPENMAATAEKYAAIDVSQIRLHMGNSQADHFFSMARQGIARFEPQVGIDKHREFITNVLGRSGIPLRQGMLETRNHTALVTRNQAERLIARMKDGAAAHAMDTLSKRDRWGIAQYHFLVAFPMLSADEQIAAMLSDDGAENILLDLMDVAKPLDERTYEGLLDKAVSDNNERAQFVVLAFGERTGTPVSAVARRHLPKLAHSKSGRVRAQALAVIGAIKDASSIDAVAKSGWNAADIGNEDSFESWYGSRVILEAAVRGVIPYEEALNRIAPQLYGEAARILGGDAAREVARRIDASIRSAAGLSLDVAVLNIEIRDTGGAEPAHYLADEKIAPSANPVDALRRLSESNEAFEERQRRIEAAFDAFKAELTKAKASIILDRLRFREFDVIVAADPKIAEGWYDLFIDLPTPRRAAIHNLGLLLAHALAESSADKAVRLFEALNEGEPLVRGTFGRAGITLDALSIWSAKDHSALEAIRFDRLDKARNDNEIALEVLAAIESGREALLKAYIEARLQSDEPAAIARALMVAGLSPDSEFNRGVLARYKDVPGFIGRAAAAAMYAYERNIWSIHWREKMRTATEGEDFWRYAVLLEKIADGRLDLDGPGAANGEPYRLFWPSVASQLGHRYKNWSGEREKKLFGEDAPPRIFLVD